MRALVFGVALLAACGGNYPKLPEPLQVADMAVEPSVSALDLLRLRDPTGSATSVDGVWDTSTSASSRGPVAQRGHEVGVLGYRLVQIGPSAVRLDDQPVVPVLDGRIPSAAIRGHRIPALLDELAVWKSAADKAAEEGVRPAFDGVLMVEVAVDATSDVLMPVVYTAGLAGFSEVRLLGTRPANLHKRRDDVVVPSLSLLLPTVEQDLPETPYVAVCGGGTTVGSREPGHPVTLAIGTQVGMGPIIDNALQYAQEGPVMVMGLGTDPCAPTPPQRPGRPATLYRDDSP